jgi:hypothetical protein
MPTPSRIAPAPKTTRRSAADDPRAERAARPAALAWDEVLAGDGWPSWQAHLAARKAPLPLTELLHGKTSPLLWALPENCDQTLVRLLQSAGQIHGADVPARIEFLEAAMQEFAARRADDRVTFGFSRLALAHAWPQLAAVTPPFAWREHLEGIISAVEEATAIPLEDDPLARLLVGGELPWTLSYLFPELRSCRRLAEAAEATLSQGLIDLLDGEGLPSAKRLSLMRPLLALWTRCGLLARAAKQACFAGDAAEQYSWLVQQAILFSRPDGGQLLTAGAEGAWSEDLFAAALALSGDRQDEALARTVLPLPAKKGAGAPRKKLPQPAFHSEWSEVALLRPEATRESPRLAISYDGSTLLAELTNRNAVIFSGAWSAEIEVDGGKLAPRGEWEEVCWTSDVDVDYLELELPLTAGWRIQRQMVLARKDEFLFVADAVLGPSVGTIDYRCTAPLASGVTFAGEAETREGTLGRARQLAVVLPLALPEWRSDRHPGSLEATPGGITLTMKSEGRAMLAPLFFDLSQRRFRKPRTWRRLTVAERLVIQPSDVAVGYRVQVGAEQWLFYRSLAPSANRTVLGQNYANEFIAGRFTAKGIAEELVSITAEPSHD